jgi:hypothetical protein
VHYKSYGKGGGIIIRAGVSQQVKKVFKYFYAGYLFPGHTGLFTRKKSESPLQELTTAIKFFHFLL